MINALMEGQPVAFDGAIIRRWAAFSGDYNPIHLDPGAARRLGAPDVIVHGMVPIACALEASDRAFAQQSRVSWRSARVRIKQPILRNQQTVLSMKPSAAKMQIRLRDAASNFEHLLGMVEQHEYRPRMEDRAGDLVIPAPKPLTFDQRAIDDQVASLKLALPDLKSTWVVLSTVMFTVFVQHQFPVLQHASLAWLGESAVARATAVQTTYQVSFSELAFASAMPSFDRLCSAFAPATLYSLKDGLSGESWMRVDIDDCCIMEIAVGLLMKAHPTHFNLA